MAKHTGITIRIGAAHDQVEVRANGKEVIYDRAAMRKDGHKELQGTVRRAVVEAWSENDRRNAKDKRGSRRAVGRAKDRAKREYA